MTEEHVTHHLREYQLRTPKSGAPTVNDLILGLTVLDPTHSGPVSYVLEFRQSVKRWANAQPKQVLNNRVSRRCQAGSCFFLPFLTTRRR